MPSLDTPPARFARRLHVPRDTDAHIDRSTPRSPRPLVNAEHDMLYSNIALTKFTLISLVICVIAALSYCFLAPRVSIPSHLLGHPALIIPELFNEDVATKLRALAKDMKEYPTNSKDVKFYATKNEHIGEAQPIMPDGSCPHRYMVPNVDGTLCVLPGRIDVGRHYFLSGGVDGLKQPVKGLTARLLSFGRYIFKLDQYPVINELFASDSFQRNAKAICPADKQVLDPFQFNFIVQVPGQTVPLHVDAVYFWGATRFHYPQWLLAVMEFSGLFQEEFIDQIQVVGYFHQWDPSTRPNSGDFVFWNSHNETIPRRVPPAPRTGNVVDGSKTVHAASTYQGHVTPPVLNKDADSALIYVGDDRWELRTGDRVAQAYSTDDLRWTIVYRARCFRSKEEVKRFNASLHSDEHMMPLDTILGRLSDDLVQRGRTTKEALSQLSRLDLSIMLIDEYVAYPLSPTAVVPYNYCAALGSFWPFC